MVRISKKNVKLNRRTREDKFRLLNHNNSEKTSRSLRFTMTMDTYMLELLRQLKGTPSQVVIVSDNACHPHHPALHMQIRRRSRDSIAECVAELRQSCRRVCRWERLINEKRRNECRSPTLPCRHVDLLSPLYRRPVFKAPNGGVEGGNCCYHDNSKPNRWKPNFGLPSHHHK